MKGTRLPETWTLPEEWKAWAIAQRPDLDILAIAEQFRDYWIAKPGQGGIKLNWQATWRNWIRRTGGNKPDHKPAAQRPYKAERLSRDKWQENKETAQKHIAQLRRKVGRV